MLWSPLQPCRVMLLLLLLLLPNPGRWVNRVPPARCGPPETPQHPPQFVFVFLVLWFFPIQVLHEGRGAGPFPQPTLSPRSMMGPISVGSS